MKGPERTYPSLWIQGPFPRPVGGRTVSGSSVFIGEESLPVFVFDRQGLGGPRGLFETWMSLIVVVRWGPSPGRLGD